MGIFVRFSIYRITHICSGALIKSIPTNINCAIILWISGTYDNSFVYIPFMDIVNIVDCSFHL